MHIMVSILKASGFESLESLQDFCNRFPYLSHTLDKDLEKIWICHKNPNEIPVSEEVNLLPSKDYYCLSKIIKNRIADGRIFYSLLTEFSAFSIFEKIYLQFNKQLATYLFTKCYLFYNWGINAFEPVIDHFEIHFKINERHKKPLTAFRKSKAKIFQDNYFQNIKLNNRDNRAKSVDLFEEPPDSTKLNLKKTVSLKSVVKESKRAAKFYEYSKNPRNSYQETFNLGKILYNTKQIFEWPKRHVLSKNNVEDLILYIIGIPVVGSDCSAENRYLSLYGNWVLLRELLEKFIKNHERIRKNYGYGRILKKHLKNVKTTPSRRLQPVPKTIICSYIFDILRKVIPIEFFGWNRVRKKFFSGLAKVINGNKHENFIWHTLLRSFLIKKTELRWCTQIGENFIQSQMILKLFKFIVIHYVFVLLKNFFYVTETGSSGFGLRFYKKNDMESVSYSCLRNLLKDRHIRRLVKSDYEKTTIERNWVETGIISELDLKRNLKGRMSPDTEYKQPIAHVRFLPKNENSDELRIITHISNKVPKNGDAACASQKLKKYFSDRLSRRKKNLSFAKLSLEFLISKLGLGIRPRPSNPRLEAAWKKAVNLKEKYGKLFFVKADISGAYDSVKYEILFEILRGAIEKESESEAIKLRKILEWKKKNFKIQKAVRFSFSSRTGENSVMIYRSFFLHSDKKINRHLDLKYVEIIKQVVTEQKMEINGKIFKLIKGLAQGSAGKFSPQLCEIYYSWMDRLYFGEFIDSNDSILLRAVDDYLFISSDVEKAKQFLQLVQNGIQDYNVSFNKEKLKSNLIDDIKEVTYLGLIFNFENMSVKPSYSKYLKGDLLSTINLFDKFGANHFKKRIFFQTRALRVNALKLHPIVTNMIHNDLKAMRQTVFEACLMQSFRVMTLAEYLYSESVKNDSAVFQVLLMSCYKISNLVKYSGLSKDEVNWLFFFAALNILQRYSGKFKLLLLLVRFRMQKCEKVFANDEGELLLKFLKSDIFEENYWDNVAGVYKLRKRPLKTA